MTPPTCCYGLPTSRPCANPTCEREAKVNPRCRRCREYLARTGRERPSDDFFRLEREGLRAAQRRTAVEWVQRFAREEGRPPAAHEWPKTAEEAPMHGLSNVGNVSRLFQDGWNGLMVAAGFWPRRPGEVRVRRRS